MSTSLKSLLTQFVVHWAAGLAGDRRAADGADKDPCERDLVSSTAQNILQKRAHICTSTACETSLECSHV
jgi:hypothetical protein